jgi:hypothetical protein
VAGARVTETEEVACEHVNINKNKKMEADDDVHDGEEVENEAVIFDTGESPSTSQRPGNLTKSLYIAKGWGVETTNTHS